MKTAYLIRPLERLRRLNSDMTITGLLVFLYVLDKSAGSETGTVRQASIQEALKLPKQTLSNALSGLQAKAINRKDNEGDGLLEQLLDPLDRRSRLVKLTRRGREVGRRIVEEDLR